MRDPIVRLNAALVGRYEIAREIGEGGMATVYLADDLRHERKVALKVLKPELAAVVGAERFLAEIKTTANLQHPHILPLFDSGEADGFLFYVMPYIDGETLRDRLDREKQLPVDEAIGIATAVAAALQTAHDAGVVHRDIKPGNVLMSQGEPLVSDFGIALAVGAAGGSRLTETGLSVGTPYYMSPEQATGDRVIGPPSDVYALACVLYEMLVGEPPYTGSTAQAVLGRIIMGTPVSATAARASIPLNVDAAIRKSLEKLPADRFPSARAFAKALADPAFRHGADVAGAGAGARSGWTPLTTGVAAIALVSIAAALWGWTRSGPPEPSDEPALRTYLDLADLDLAPGGDIVISPDGSRFAVAARGADGVRGVYVRNADETRFRLIPGTEDGDYPSFSPDGDWIAYINYDVDALLRVSLSGGAPRVIVPAGFPIFFPDWGDDGTIIFSGRGEAGVGIYRVSETGGAPELVLAGDLYNARLLPGGRAMIATTSQEGPSTVFFAFGDDSARTLIPGGVDARYIETGYLLYADASGGLWAVGFDPDKGTLLAEPTPVLDGLTVAFGEYARYAVSRNGTFIYGAGGGVGADRASRLLVVDLEGNEDIRPLEPRVFLGLRWSPDGASVAYSQRGDDRVDIFTYNVELGTTPRQLTFEGNNFDPVWSPDGTRLAFGSRQGGDDGDLLVKTVGDDTPPQRILARPGDQRPEDWLAEDLLLFTEWDGETQDLWIVDPADSSSARPYLTAEASLAASSVSPDGSLAAYTSRESGQTAVYVRGFPTPRQPVRVSAGAGAVPRWAPDGRSLYYWSTTSGADTLLAARVQLEPTFTVLSTDVLFVADYSSFGWDLHPDGDRLIVAQRLTAAGEESGEREPERFVVVSNWFTELRAALGEEP